MGKRVIITLMEGSFEQGFPVILRIREDDAAETTETEIQGKLPPAPSILELFNDWQLAYRHLVLPHSRIRPSPAQVTNFSCRQLGDELDKRLNDWLNSGTRDWQRIRDRLQRSLSETEEIQVIIQTEDIRLRRLPWHLWDLFSNHYTKAEIALSAPEYKPLGKTARLTNKVRILAILGDSTDIDVQKDREMLKQLSDAETIFLEEPQRQELYNQLWEQQWEIIFFAGHSFSEVDGDTGKIYINSTDSLSIVELKNALRSAIEGGLQLAIFNSCDGLGLARELADLHIPQIIVMREPVPDLVAQEFLKHFLRSFAQGKSLYLAVREARERLQSLEEQFPFASWLPVIYQNPAEIPLSWQNLFRKTANERIPIIQRDYNSLRLFVLFLISLILTIGLVHRIPQKWIQFPHEWIQSIWSGIPSDNWKAEYFDNINLKGKPVFIENLGNSSKKLSRLWGFGAPENTPVDNFSVEITTKRYFAPGIYLIKVNADDGISVWIDDQNVINKWNDQNFSNRHCALFKSEGKKYPVTMQYYEKDGHAALSLDIQPYKSFKESVSGTECKIEEPVNHTEWRSTFFQWNKNQDVPPGNFYEIEANIIGIFNLGSNQRSDGKSGIQLNWGTVSPMGHWDIPADFFAVRSYTQAHFEAGKTYRALVKANSGFQLLAQHGHTDKVVNITKPKDKWEYAYGAYKEFKFTVPLSGMYDFHFHLYKGSGNASIDLFWEETTSSTITSVNFTGKVGPTAGVSLCLGRSLNTCSSEQEPYNKTLNFEGWSYGETVNDMWTGKPDALWFKLSSRNLWIPSAYIKGYPPSKPSLQPAISNEFPLCSGGSCIGRDPHDNKCDINPEPRIITSTVGNFPATEGRLGTFKIQLRYSEQCKSTWVWSTAPFDSTYYLEDRKGNKYGQAEVPKDLSPYHFSDMGPGNIQLKACAEPPGGKTKCTNFVKPWIIKFN